MLRLRPAAQLVQDPALAHAGLAHDHGEAERAVRRERLRDDALELCDSGGPAGELRLEVVGSGRDDRALAFALAEIHPWFDRFELIRIETVEIRVDGLGPRRRDRRMTVPGQRGHEVLPPCGYAPNDMFFHEFFTRSTALGPAPKAART